jgi:hypothetical protein
VSSCVPFANRYAEQTVTKGDSRLQYRSLMNVLCAGYTALAGNPKHHPFLPGRTSEATTTSALQNLRRTAASRRDANPGGNPTEEPHCWLVPQR